VQTRLGNHSILISLFLTTAVWYSELADLTAHVQRIREQIRYLRASVAEKNAIQKQNRQLEAELHPIKEKARKLHSHAVKLANKLVHEGLAIAKKERAFQSTQIAQRIDGISATMVYDATPVSSPKHSPIHSPYHSPIHSTNVSLSGSAHSSHGSVRDDLFRNLRSRNDSDCRSETSGLSFRSEMYTPGKPGTGKSGAGSLAQAPTVSSYDEEVSAQLDPDMIWKAPNKSVHITAHAATVGKTGAHRNFIRQRLRDLQDIRRIESDAPAESIVAEGNPHEARRGGNVKVDSAVKISFSMLNS
jgi:cell division protein FtsB